MKFLYLVIVTMATVLAHQASHAGSWQNNVTTGGFNRVHIYTPDSQSSVGEGKALLIVLHGCTQSIDAYLTANLEQAAEAYGMVIAVPDAMNKAGFSCWSYWQGAKTRTSGDYKNLINLAGALSNDAAYNIDENQVYIAGLSSGAAFANTTACIAPDVFAGMGVSAGPSIGTSSGGAIGSCEAANVAQRCQQYAGSYAGFLDTQIASIAHGDADTTVDQCYNRQNAEGMAAVYNVAESPGTTTIGSSSRTAEEHRWTDGRVSMLWLNGVDHAWSGGQGASGSYINGNGINYAMYLGEYFANNNQRVNRNEAPVLTNLNLSAANSQITISGQVTDADGSVDTIFIQVQDDADNIYQYSTQALVGETFSVTTSALPDALYYIDANASDNEGAISLTQSDTIRIGPPPPQTAPELSNIQVVIQAQCADITGEVIDINQDLTRVTVAFSNATKTAEIDGRLFKASACKLPGGQQSATVTATDSTQLTTSAQLTFSIDAGITDNLDGHIAAGRLDYTNYSNCYLEYSSNPFKLNEIGVTGQQCQWQDNDNSCAGPVQACSGNQGGGSGGGNGDGSDDQCASFTTANYYHKVAGRAFSTGNYWSPNYFAVGSNDPLTGSTWGNSTLSSLDGESWYEGDCP
ncbi:extracellular catalytic domain type 1 short-chain-length polyhydroxyalkanoate depolymerase [Alteromonas ponticola]|uniref:PHB depolymerase family esterase n=1 Tax=Alteromonas ponticola TaxID=2720613 RepID=A0ABX1R522_9ALTE|nr:PHB depolymerase family esterase [Alteromonas ponticola]NMH60986.1 PHB depolymerase family esterase [Alteromonas ponticola]